MDKFIIGFGGVLVGAIVTIALYWHSRYSSAKQALYNRLSLILYDVQWNCESSQNAIFKMWDPSLKELLPLYNDVMLFAPPFKRDKIRKAWQEYKGENQAIMKGLANEITDSKMFPKSKQEFKLKIDTLLQALKKR
jgi:hypothetical protein